MNETFWILVFVTVLVWYFLPSMIAGHREHPNKTPIFIVNLFLGWTLLGWVATLAWAFSQSSERA